MAKAKAKPELTDSDRHRRFVVMAREVEAEDSAQAFDEAFQKVAPVPKPKPKPTDHE